ncbi:hypothetical protein LCGC14_0471840 [marine sediment metagenome]|uniref:Uncharacterized protein n=1 Tax=marine sediment metagenome TaxID=412755 RepID=A0A0F9VKQ6_9ZZZZ
MNMPSRMTTGRYLVGPDFYGCSNTGMAPAILKSNALASYGRLGLARGLKFAVGPQVYIADAISDVVRGRMKKGATWTNNNGLHKVRLFKTYKAAKAYFEKLVAAAIATNVAEQVRHRELLRKAKAGDQQAVLDLANY